MVAAWAAAPEALPAQLALPVEPAVLPVEQAAWAAGAAGAAGAARAARAARGEGQEAEREARTAGRQAQALALPVPRPAMSGMREPALL